MINEGIFISYNSVDYKLANQLCKALEKKGVKVWFAPKSIEASEHYAGKITEGIEQCALVILIASKNSIGDRRRSISGSQEVVKEIQLAQNNKKKLLPINVDKSLEGDFDKNLTYHLSTTQWVDISNLNDTQRQLDLIVSKTIKVLSLADSETFLEDITFNKQEETLKSVELALMRNDLHVADKLLEDKNFTPSFYSQFSMMNIFKELLVVSLFKNLDKPDSDRIIGILKKVIDSNDTQYHGLCWCLMANLAKKYYEINGLQNPGYNYISALTEYRKIELPRMSARHKMILRNIKDYEQL